MNKLIFTFLVHPNVDALTETVPAILKAERTRTYTNVSIDTCNYKRFCRRRAAKGGIYNRRQIVGSGITVLSNWEGFLKTVTETSVQQ